jgi:hypothetical protein
MLPARDLVVAGVTPRRGNVLLRPALTLLGLDTEALHAVQRGGTRALPLAAGE